MIYTLHTTSICSFEFKSFFGASVYDYCLHVGELDSSATVLRFYYIDSPPPLSVGLFFIHNHADGSYSGWRLLLHRTCLDHLHNEHMPLICNSIARSDCAQ